MVALEIRRKDMEEAFGRLTFFLMTFMSVFWEFYAVQDRFFPLMERAKKAIRAEDFREAEEATLELTSAFEHLKEIINDAREEDL